jgi:hypothetical protein
MAAAVAVGAVDAISGMEVGRVSIRLLPVER